MEERQKAALRRHHVAMVQDLEPRGGVLDALHGDGVLTENDCERVEAAATRRERCQVLLHLLPTRGPAAYGAFQRALHSSSYDFLAQMLDTDTTDHTGETVGNNHREEGDNSANRQRGVKCCKNCCKFVRWLDSSAGNKRETEIVRLIRAYGCLILDNVEPIDVIDQIFQDQILDIDEIDGIKSERTRRKRCESLLQALVNSSNPGVSDTLVRSLNRKYKFIVSQITKITAASYVARNSDSDDETETKLVYSSPQGENREKVHKLVESHDSHAPDETHVKTCNNTDSLDGGTTVSFPMTEVTQSMNTDIQLEEEARQRNKDCDSRPAKEAPTLLTTISKGMAVIPTESSHKSRRLTVAFNYLSTLINQGDFDKYEAISSRLRHWNPRNYDMLCIIGYLNASRDLFRTDFDAAKLSINSTLQLVPKTSNPRYFLLELFTARTRMYITQKKLEKLQTTLDEAMMVLETDPAGCTGRAAGWLYINDARNRTAQISCLNLSKPNALKLYESLFLRAKSSFQRSMNNFKMDGGKDGPFGFGYALCRLTILLLRCGDNGMTMGLLKPPTDDVIAAGQYLHHLEDSDVTIPKILDVHYLLAKCDFQFRRENFVRSLQHAQAAFDLATELNMLEFTEHAHNRVKYLRSMAPVCDSFHDVSEEEAQRILFCQSSDSLDTSQSE